MTSLKNLLRIFSVTSIALTAQLCFTSKVDAQQLQPEDIWNNRGRLVLDNRYFGSSFGMHFTSTLEENNTLYSYYISYSVPGKISTGLAQSTDGINFVDQGSVTIPGTSFWDNKMASFPGISKLATNRWAMLYEGAGESPGDIGLAMSNDRKNFIKDTLPILRHTVRQKDDPQGIDLQWEKNNIGTPSLYTVNGVRYLFYHGYGKSWDGGPDDCQVGVAIGTDLRNMRRYSANPVLKTGARGAWDSGTIGKRDIIRGEDGWFYMVYEGSTDLPYDNARWSTGLARSKDLLRWDKYANNPILPRTTSGFGYDGPEWIRTPDGQLHIYYRHPNGPTSRATVVR